MRVLVLDFDGVVADSARESLATALRTYGELHPQSRIDANEPSSVRETFLELMPLGNRAEDFGVALFAIDHGREPRGQADHDRLRDELGSRWADRFHRRFYENRHAAAGEDPVGWRALMPPYPQMIELLRRRRGSATFAIATAKDLPSVEALLRDYGIDDLFDPHHVLDKSLGRDKRRHLETLRQRLEVPFAEMTFVDDKVNHLDGVASLGVRCVLASWGYNGAREQRVAAESGYLVCSLADFEASIFGEA